MNKKLLVVPSDFSETSDLALEHAIEFARALACEIRLLHVHEPSPSWGYETAMVPEMEASLAAREERGIAERAARVRDRGLACQAVRREGRPWQEILACASELGAALIVMGTHGRTGLAHVFLGSVTERVVARAPCPVVVVPPPGSSEETRELAP